MQSECATLMIDSTSGGHALEVRFYLDPETDLPHIYGHGVTEEEVEQVLRASGATSRALGIADEARPDLGWALSPGDLLARRGTGSVFVITAYELTGKAKKAYRRRRRRKPR